MSIFMKKILPINKKPYFRTYTHHGFLHAIISADDKVVYNNSSAVAEISVKDYDLWEWNTQVQELVYKMDNSNHIKFYSNRWNQGMNMAFWRDCRTDDEIEICIYKQLYSNPWGAINLFLTNHNQADMKNMDLYEIRIGNFSKDGLYYMTSQEPYTIILSNPSLPINLKLIRRKENVILEYSTIEGVVSKTLITQLKDKYSLNRIGFAINLGNNSYYEWLFSNYINIYKHPFYGVSFDILNTTHKDWSVHSSDYFIDYNIISEKDISEFGYTLLEYIKKQIDLNNYIEIEINENIHFKLPDSDDIYFHQNLVYGYDDEEMLLYMLYYNAGTIQSITMSYNDFLSERNSQLHRKIHVMKYSPGYEKYELIPSHLLQVYKEFQEGCNISYYEPDLNKYCIFGIDCLKELFTENGIDEFLSDVRICQLLLERVTCNKDRMEFLYFKEELNITTYLETIRLLNEQIKNFKILRSLIVKKYCGRKIDVEKVRKLVIENYEMEIDFLNIIIPALEMYSYK